MKTQIARTTFKPSSKPFVNSPDCCEVLFKFGETFEREFNTLLADETGKLFLGDTEDKRSGAVPDKSDLHEVTLAEALDWYVRMQPQSEDATGTLELLAEMAAAQLKAA